ncbi:FAD-linked sulfhydryl oxidase ERV2, partial [Penicillium chermesinum]
TDSSLIQAAGLPADPINAHSCDKPPRRVSRHGEPANRATHRRQRRPLNMSAFFPLYSTPRASESSRARPGHIVHPSTNAPGIVIQDDLLKGAVVMPRLGNETVKAELGRATWKYFHTVMARFPEKPTTDEQDALRSYIYLFARLYPCGECAEHFQQHLNKYPPQVSSRKAAAGWACFIHNEVNVMLDKPEFDCNDLGAFYDCGCAGDEDEAGAEDGTHPATSRAAGKSDEPDPLDHLAVEISKE